MLASMHSAAPAPFVRRDRGASRDPLDLTYGIEEEFFLIDPASRELVTTPSGKFLRACRLRLPDRVGEELLQAQLEVVTPILHSADHARESLSELRFELGRIGNAHGIGLVASGTHPLANWEDQRHTDKPRYDQLTEDFQIVARRNLLCGLHVHVGVPEGADRVSLMHRLMPWVPVFLALSTSSPFWNGRPTGLFSYRQAAYDEWPRSGIPDDFTCEEDYAGFIDLLARCGALTDGSFLWWAVRPSARFPTLELRIADACTRLEDSLALAAAFRCLVRAHLRQPGLGATRTAFSRRVIDENRWRAKRYGTEASFIDEEAEATLALPDVVERMLRLLAPDADALNCEKELAHLRTIVLHGTSAHAQLALYRDQRTRCLSRNEALLPVIDWLAAETVSATAGRSPASPPSRLRTAPAR
ncbi:carboxylate-amine ligase [Lysobacter niabensis]|uniref:carboxylate-amine ligase n=1 Tax=Agrilutibacter niabensis TaxID=380628 RepID=UPI003608305E